MRLLWACFPFTSAEPWLEGLKSLGHDVSVFQYTQHDDRAFMDVADNFKPDAIIYLGMATWDKTPAPKTFARLRKICPVVHLSGDLSDPPWFPFLEKYREAESFTRTVNIDGNPNWPSEHNDLTLLSPTAPHFFSDQAPLAERPIPFGFAGGYSSPSRREIIEHLVIHGGLTLKRYDHQYGSYDSYARFLTSCIVVPNIPISGSDAVRQVKGRVLECGESGCVLLDREDSWACKWFDAGIDFITYRTKEEAAELSRVILADLDFFQKTATSLQKRVLNEHSPEKFWGKTLGGLA